MWTAAALTMFWIFVPISLVTIGGGYAIVGEMQRQLVDVHHFMTTKQFMDAFALSRAAPGPGSLMVTYIGWQVAGFWGAFLATAGIYAPAVTITYVVANIWRRFKGARWQRALELGLRPVAAGLILGSVYVLIATINGGWMARALVLVSTAILMSSKKVHPLVMLISGAGVYVLIRQALPA